MSLSLLMSLCDSKVQKYNKIYLYQHKKNNYNKIDAYNWQYNNKNNKYCQKKRTQLIKPFSLNHENKRKLKISSLKCKKLVILNPTILKKKHTTKKQILEQIFSTQSLNLKSLNFGDKYKINEKLFWQSNISFVPFYVNLRDLNCSGMKIMSLDALKNCKNLIHLKCSFNKLKNLNGLENCINLVIIDCSHNQIENLVGLEKSHNLWKLDCSNNCINSLNGIQNCVRLKS